MLTVANHRVRGSEQLLGLVQLLSSLRISVGDNRLPVDAELVDIRKDRTGAHSARVVIVDSGREVLVGCSDSGCWSRGSSRIGVKVEQIAVVG